MILRSLALCAALALAPLSVHAQSLGKQFPTADELSTPSMFRGVSMSDDGRYMSGIRRNPDGGYVLVVIDLQTKKVTPIQYASVDSDQTIEWTEFKGNDLVVFGLRARVMVKDGGNSIRKTAKDEDALTNVSRAFVSNITGGDVKPLLEIGSGDPFLRRISQLVVDTLPNDPDHMLLRGVTERGVALYRVNVRTLDADVVDSGGFDTIGWGVDVTGDPVLRQEQIAGGRGRAWSYKNEAGKWVEIVRFRGASGANSGPTFNPIGPGPKPGQMFVAARRDGENTSALHLFDARKGIYIERTFAHEEFDISDAIVDRSRGVALAACYNAHTWECEPLDEKFGAYYLGLKQVFGEQASVFVAERSEPDGRWIVQVETPTSPANIYSFTHDGVKLEKLLDAYPHLANRALSTVEIVKYKAQDGTDLFGYLHVPHGYKQDKNLPMIVMPHGGPEGRDLLGFDQWAQFLSTRGYLVFQPNFRGGGGFGRAFVTAGWGQWGKLMQTDVTDGARALIASGRADPNRVCVWGWSYGGYVASISTVLNKDLYKCSVSGAGVHDMQRMQAWTREEQGGTTSVSYKYWTESMGGTENTPEFNTYSAARRASEIDMPYMLIHGELDTTVPIEQSEIMERAMKAAGKPIKHVRIPEMTHSPDKVGQTQIIFKESEAFLREHLGPGVPPKSN